MTTLTTVQDQDQDHNCKTGVFQTTLLFLVLDQCRKTDGLIRSYHITGLRRDILGLCVFVITGRRSLGTGADAQKFGVESTLPAGISMSAEIFSLLCEFCVCDIMLLPFPSRSEAYAIKLGHSQVMDFLRHSGSDRPLNFAMDQLLNIWLDYEIASEVVDKLTLF